MLKQTLLAASLAVLLAGPALAGDPGKRNQDGVAGMVNRVQAKSPPAKPDKERKPDAGQGPVKDLERMPVPVRDKRDNAPRKVDLRGDERFAHRDDGRDPRDSRRDLPDRVWRAVDHRDDDRRDDHDWRDRDRDWRDRDHDRDRDWRDRDHDRDHDWRRDEWRDRDWRRDDGWRRRGWIYNGWRNDGWRYYRFNDNRHWRYVPPYRYSLDQGYRSGYELAWRDWLDRGRYDRYWHRSAFFGFGIGSLYRSGYEAGWRDAAYYYDRGYRPDYWGYDPQGGWFFSFRIEG
jgi:hypothetical protein